MAQIACPSCGEDDRLSGERRGEDRIDLVCEACGHRWTRGTELRCRLCGSHDLKYTPEAIWEKARGTAETPTGLRDAYACWTCGGRAVTSARPIPGPES